MSGKEKRAEENTKTRRLVCVPRYAGRSREDERRWEGRSDQIHSSRLGTLGVKSQRTSMVPRMATSWGSGRKGSAVSGVEEEVEGREGAGKVGEY